MLMMGRLGCVGIGYVGTLYFILKFALNLKTALKNKAY